MNLILEDTEWAVIDYFNSINKAPKKVTHEGKVYYRIDTKSQSKYERLISESRESWNAQVILKPKIDKKTNADGKTEKQPEQNTAQKSNETEKNMQTSRQPKYYIQPDQFLTSINYNYKPEEGEDAKSDFKLKFQSLRGDGKYSQCSHEMLKVLDMFAMKNKQVQNYEHKACKEHEIQGWYVSEERKNGSAPTSPEFIQSIVPRSENAIKEFNENLKTQGAAVHQKNIAEDKKQNDKKETLEYVQVELGSKKTAKTQKRKRNKKTQKVEASIEDESEKKTGKGLENKQAQDGKYAGMPKAQIKKAKDKATKKYKNQMSANKRQRTETTDIDDKESDIAAEEQQNLLHQQKKSYDLGTQRNPEHSNNLTEIRESQVEEMKKAQKDLEEETTCLKPGVESRDAELMAQKKSDTIKLKGFRGKLARANNEKLQQMLTEEANKDQSDLSNREKRGIDWRIEQIQKQIDIRLAKIEATTEQTATQIQILRTEQQLGFKASNQLALETHKAVHFLVNFLVNKE